MHWTGILTSLLLLGWAAGGVMFGAICDRIGRLRTLMLTMLLYAVGTAACAGATNLWMLAIFRLVASLGIGGEWAAGASMVAEVMPEKRRVEGGALLYTAAPFGLFLATFINYQVAGVWFANNTEQSWRYVFLFGLLPATIAFIVRLFVHEPERWESVKSRSRARVREIFTPQLRRTTLLGTLTVVIALIGWWSCSAFIPVIASGLARTAAEMQGLDKGATQSLIEHWKVTGTMAFNVGGLIGTLLTIPIAKRLGRRPMFALYFGAVSGRLFHDFWPRYVGASAAVHVLCHWRPGVWGLWRLSLLPSGVVPDAAARHRRWILLQHRAGAGIGRAIPGGRGIGPWYGHADNLLCGFCTAVGIAAGATDH